MRHHSAILDLQDLMAGAASLLVDANLLVAFGTAPKSTALDSFLSRPQRHGIELLHFSDNPAEAGHDKPCKQSGMIVNGSWGDNAVSYAYHFHDDVIGLTRK